VNTNFSYCLLNYVHSQFLDEKLNVGILFYFKNSNKLSFKYPKNFKRLKELYGDFSEWQLKSHLEAIVERVQKLNNQPDSFFHLPNGRLIVDEILKKDATVLQFSEIKHSINEAPDSDSIINNYYNLYFSNYLENATIKEKHDEAYLLKTFKNKLFTKNSSIHNLLYKDVVITSAKTSVNFDYKWKNGVENLVKPVGFDLEEESSINHKAILLYGQLNFIKDEVKGFNIDIITSEPESTDRKLKKAYKKGIEIIKQAGVQMTIYHEMEVEKYVNKVAKEIHAPSHE